MTKEYLLSAIGDIDDDLIAEAADIRPVRRIPLWAKYTAAAACLCLCAVVVLSFPGFMRCGSMAPESANKQDAAVMEQDDFFYTAEDALEMKPEAALTEYLRDLGCEITCLSVVRETEGEKDEIRDYGGESVIVHTMGVTTVTVTLDGIPEESILQGLGETVRHIGLGNVKKVIILADGEEIWQGEW